MIGQHYDIIGIDPRVARPTQLINCYTEPFERLRAFSRDPIYVNSEETLGGTWSVAKTLAGRCFDNAREDGELMGTAFVARDLMRVVDAFDEDGLLRYWDKYNLCHC